MSRDSESKHAFFLKNGSGGLEKCGNAMQSKMQPVTSAVPAISGKPVYMSVNEKATGVTTKLQIVKVDEFK